VAGRYKGRIHGWDVVNEAINDGAGDYRQSVFYKVIGKEYLALAFKWAHDADPGAELYYNDYNLDANDNKRATALELVKYLREQGCKVDGIGLQGHYNLTTPTIAKIDETIGLFATLGLKVHITELDVTAVRGSSVSGAVGFNPGAGRGRGGPRTPLSADEAEAQAKRYAEIFTVFLKHRAAIERVTFWGLRDADSWRRQFHPLIFDDAYGRKPAYDAILATPRK
jgi:endo-1,4-beta-xylanase